MAKKLIEFVPKTNKWFKSIKTTTFTIVGTFVFIEKNIFQLFFKNITKVTSKFYSRSKNKINVIGKKIKLNLVILFKELKKSNILFKTKVRPNIKLNYQSNSNFKIIIKARPFVKLSFIPQKSFMLFKSSILDLIIINFISKNKFEANSNLNIRTLFKLKSLNNKFTFKGIQQKSYIAFSAKYNCEYQIKGNGNITNFVKFKYNLYPISISAKAIPYVYRPKLLGELYPDKIGDWYDKDLEEVFYGQELF